MDDLLARFWSDLVGRLTGPMIFRLILQPIMAMLYAVRDGLKDAREGRPAYFWSILKHPTERGSLLKEGWKAVLRVFTLGVVMDAIYQLIVFRWIHPLELIVVALLLAFVPYVLMRGPANRIACHWKRSRLKP
jgi:hypothetical protein